MADHLSKIIFPRAFAFAIDDLGWNEGSDLSMHTPPGPFRAGVKRVFDLNDYRHIVEIGRAVGARIQCLFILSEMDRENILARYPTTTYQRSRWNNSQRVNDQQLEIMRYVVEQSAFMEFGLHGTGHEYWAEDGIQRRAEWYNLTDHKPWPEQSIRDHIFAFEQIMRQYDISKEHGHSFPESFVPCAYSYYWNPGGAYSLGKLLQEAGVKYANTDFSQIPELNPPSEINGGGFDHGTHVINRINYGNPWYQLNSLPTTPIEQQDTDIIESHWPNWLAQDDHLQTDVTNRWVAYYRNIQLTADRYIAKNTEQLHSQWLYKRFTVITEARPGSIEIDNSAMPDEAYKNELLGNLVLKIKIANGEHVDNAKLNDQPIAAYFEDHGFAFLYMPPLEQKKYSLTYSVGSSLLPVHVFNNGTYNIYHVVEKSNSLSIDLKMYGSQVMRIKCPAPKSLTSSSNRVVIDKYFYDNFTGYLIVHLTGKNMQGERTLFNVEC